ncbi:MAG TPA: phosphatase PAP2 family protein [Chthoniobacterales bacterium]
MREFDHSIIFFFNQFAKHWHTFDEILVFFTNSDLMKGGVVLAFFWWAWLRRSQDFKLNRSYLLSALAGAVVALFVARILAHVLPLRVRPISDPTLHFRPPAGMPDQSNWTIWSSFPSDHAALFGALLTGIWLAWRTGGIALMFYVIFLIFFPRIYIGIHYPTDILGGAAIGVSCVLLCSWKPLRQLWTEHVLNWFDRRPGPAYALLFIITFQIATLFWDIRTFLYIFDISV